jgi:hypothetical protein
VIDDLPAIPGFDECYGRSIFHCPYCDGLGNGAIVRWPRSGAALTPRGSRSA